MSQEKPVAPVSVVALRAESCSADGAFVIVSLRTKYSSAERKYSIPIECFHDLTLDLRRLNASNKDSDRVDNKTEPLLPLDLPMAAE
jgi:hypothetical protein